MNQRIFQGRSPSGLEVAIRSEIRTKAFSISRLKRCVREMLQCLGWKKAGVSILFVSGRKIRRLNRQYLGHDRVTDVIAFGQHEKICPRHSAGQGPFLGDIVISLDAARRQARIFGNSFHYELCFYLCHGILHLMGYDDKSEKQRKRMNQWQTKILKEIGIQNKERKS